MAHDRMFFAIPLKHRPLRKTVWRTISLRLLYYSLREAAIFSKQKCNILITKLKMWCGILFFYIRYSQRVTGSSHLHPNWSEYHSVLFVYGEPAFAWLQESKNKSWILSRLLTYIHTNTRMQPKLKNEYRVKTTNAEICPNKIWDGVSVKTTHPRWWVVSTKARGLKGFFPRKNIAPIFTWIDNCLEVTNRDKSWTLCCWKITYKPMIHHGKGTFRWWWEHLKQ